LDFSSLLALYVFGPVMKKQQRAAALQNFEEFSSGLSKNGHTFLKAP
jgi:hypothetical protein